MSQIQLLGEVKILLQNARRYTVQQINLAMVKTYYQIGYLIVEYQQEGKSRAVYAAETLKYLSLELTKDFGKGFSVQNLERMRNFYLVYEKRFSEKKLNEFQTNSNSSTVSAIFQDEANSSTVSGIFKKAEIQFQLSWSHYVFLIGIDNVAERNFYEIESIENHWSLRELKRQFDSGLYERLALSRNKERIRELSEKGQIIEQPQDIIKEPLVLEFLGLPEKYEYSETQLENAIIDRLQDFMLELGKGFLFESRQKRITFDEKHFYIDLSFYNRILRCFVLIDLKIGELSHQDIGQMQMYVNYYDRFVKQPDENQTIGIILCKKKSEMLVEISLPERNRQIFASKYQTVLPSKDDFKKLIEATG